MSAATSTINVPGLIELAEWVGVQEARRELGLASEWDQNVWLTRKGELVPVNGCGTAACLAGRAALAAGWVPAPYAYAALGRRLSDDGDVIEGAEYEADDWESDGTDSSLVSQVTYEGNGAERRIVAIDDTREVRDVAAEILGLDDEQANRLFEGDNLYEDVMEIIGNLIAQSGISAEKLARL